MNFTGFCSYPLGGKVSGGLILSTSAALAATMYACASCRFVVITFTSTTGGFEEYYNTNRGGGDDISISYRAAVGLYQWLRPTDPINWSHGSCAGYQQTMLAEISDVTFEVARTFGVFAVLTAMLEVCWVFLTACLDMNRIQGILFCILSFLGTISTGLTFIFHKSALCETEFISRECKIDQGGLVMIAAVFFWLITFVLSFWFVLPSIVKETDEDRVNRLDRQRLTRSIEQSRKNRQSGKSNSNKRKASAMLKSRNSKSNTMKKSSSNNNNTSNNNNNNKNNTTLPLHSYSFDSQTDWTRPIPKRSKVTSESNTKSTTSSAKSNGQILVAPSTIVQPRQKAVVTVDDVSTKDNLEVYISKRLDHIEKLAEV